MTECRKLPANMADILTRINEQATQTPEGQRSFPLLDLYRNLDVRAFFEPGAQTKDAFLYMSEAKLGGLTLPYMDKEAFQLKGYDDTGLRCLFEATGYPKEKIEKDIISIKALASDPLAGIAEGTTTVDQYVDGLPPIQRSVYLALDLFGEIKAAYGADGIMDRDEYTGFVESYFGPKQTDEEFNANGQKVVENAHVILGLVSFLSTQEPESQPSSSTTNESPPVTAAETETNWGLLGQVAGAITVVFGLIGFGAWLGKLTWGNKGSGTPVPPKPSPNNPTPTMVEPNREMTRILEDLSKTETLYDDSQPDPKMNKTVEVRVPAPTNPKMAALQAKVTTKTQDGNAPAPVAVERPVLLKSMYTYYPDFFAETNGKQTLRSEISAELKVIMDTIVKSPDVASKGLDRVVVEMIGPKLVEWSTAEGLEGWKDVQLRAVTRLAEEKAKKVAVEETRKTQKTH